MTFADAMGEVMERELPEFSTTDNVNNALQQRERNFNHSKNQLLEQIQDIWNNTTIRVGSVPEGMYKIDKDNIVDDMERLQVLSANIREDIFEFNKSLSRMKACQHGLAMLIANYYNSSNLTRPKTNKELENKVTSDHTYMASSIKIDEMKALISRSESMLWSLNQQVGFVREVLKMATQRLFNGA